VTMKSTHTHECVDLLQVKEHFHSLGFFPHHVRSKNFRFAVVLSISTYYLYKKVLVTQIPLIHFIYKRYIFPTLSLVKTYLDLPKYAFRNLLLSSEPDCTRKPFGGQVLPSTPATLFHPLTLLVALCMATPTMSREPRMTTYFRSKKGGDGSFMFRM
jgi:hypothetical protein